MPVDKVSFDEIGVIDPGTLDPMAAMVQRMESLYDYSTSSHAQLIEKWAALFDTESAVFTSHRISLISAQQSEWTVVPADPDSPADKECAKFIESCLDDMSSPWSRFIDFAMSAQAFGYADVEIVWKRRLGLNPPKGLPISKFNDGLIGVRKLSPRRQETLAGWDKDKEGGVQAFLQYQLIDDKLVKVPIPIIKMLHFIGGDDRGGWEGKGWLKPAHKIATRIGTMEFVADAGWHRSFVGLPHFHWQGPPKNESESQLVRQIGEKLAVDEQAYIQTPNQVDFSLITVSNANASALQSHIDQMRWEIMSLVTLTFMRLGVTNFGSRALASPLMDLYALGIDSALDVIAEVLNRFLVPRLLQANGSKFAGISEYPKIVHSKVTKVASSLIPYLSAIQKFLEEANPLDAAWLRQEAGLPSQEDIEEWEEENKPEEPTPPAPPAPPTATPTGESQPEQKGGKEMAPEEKKEEAAAPSKQEAPSEATEQARVIKLAAPTLDSEQKRRSWGNAQAQNLVATGFSAALAKRIIDFILERMPLDVDPSTWSLSMQDQAVLAEVMREFDVDTAAQDWDRFASPELRGILYPADSQKAGEASSPFEETELIGTSGSGNWGHAGRPRLVGGSAKQGAGAGVRAREAKRSGQAGGGGGRPGDLDSAAGLGSSFGSGIAGEKKIGGQHAFAASFVDFKDGTRAVVKPDVTSYRRKDINGFQSTVDGEVAAYALDVELQTHVVPATIETEHNGVRCSAQRFVKGESAMQRGVEMWDPQRIGNADDHMRMEVLDYAMRNIDRHSGNYMLRPDGSVIGIDHGMAFQGSGPKVLPGRTWDVNRLVADIRAGRKGLSGAAATKFDKWVRHVTTVDPVRVGDRVRRSIGAKRDGSSRDRAVADMEARLKAFQDAWSKGE